MTERATTKHENRLRELREAAGDSRAQVAVALGQKSHKPVERWENGDADIPIYHARKLADRYRVSLSYLLCDENGGEGKAA